MKENIVNRNIKKIKSLEVFEIDITYIVLLTVTEGLIILPTEIVNRAVIHSDRGSQFTSNNYKNLLEYFGVTQSMLLSANPKDNAVIESFFGYMKDEIYNTNRKQWGKNIITLLNTEIIC